MNLFRSEEHVRNWSGFQAGTEEGIVRLPDMLGIFSGNFFRRRLDPDYMSRFREYAGEFVKAVAALGRPFWAP